MNRQAESAARSGNLNAQTELFGDIAQRYDGINRVLSMGRDNHWRRLAADALRLPPGGCVLDVGIGTGDVALVVTERRPDAAVVGLDTTIPMMDVGRKKLGGDRVAWTQGDGLRLPFPDRHFDAAISAFLLRNIFDGQDRRPVAQALAEQRRVVREGGQVVSLELSWPQTPVFRTLFRLYFAGLMPPVAGLLSGKPAAYRYLPRSVHRFLTPGELTETMEVIGLRNVGCRRLALGTVTLHFAERGSDEEEGPCG